MYLSVLQRDLFPSLRGDCTVRLMTFLLLILVFAIAAAYVVLNVVVIHLLFVAVRLVKRMVAGEKPGITVQSDTPPER